jgi:hypothetical protein
MLEAHGLTRWQHHPFTDVMALRERFGFSCLNLSCGYYNWHRPDEYVALNEVEAALASAVGPHHVGDRCLPFWQPFRIVPPRSRASFVPL